MPEPRTLTEAMDNLRAAWRELIDALEYPFGRGIHEPAPGLHDMRSDLHDMRGLHVPVRETGRILYRWLLILGAAHFIMIAALLLYAMATGQFDWSAG